MAFVETHNERRQQQRKEKKTSEASLRLPPLRKRCSAGHPTGLQGSRTPGWAWPAPNPTQTGLKTPTQPDSSTPQSATPFRQIRSRSPKTTSTGWLPRTATRTDEERGFSCAFLGGIAERKKKTTQVLWRSVGLRPERSRAPRALPPVAASSRSRPHAAWLVTRRLRGAARRGGGRAARPRPAGRRARLGGSCAWLGAQRRCTRTPPRTPQSGQLHPASLQPTGRARRPSVFPSPCLREKRLPRPRPPAPTSDAGVRSPSFRREEPPAGHQERDRS